jgi:hypothetical protein
MVTQSLSVHIRRPPEEVFAWLTDTRNHPRWDTTSLEMEASEVPWKAGSEFREVRRIGGRTMTLRSRCASLETNRPFDMESVTGPAFHGHWRIEPDAGGTLLRWSAEMRPGGIARIFEGAIQRSFRRQTAQNFERMKALIETDPPG